MNTKQYKLIIQYNGNAQDVLFFKNKRKAVDAYHQSDFNSCVAWACLFNSSGKQIFDY